MGNWRRVGMIGSCDPQELPALQDAIAVDDDYENFHCLSGTEGIYGLNNWASISINAVGNLAERDYGVEDIEKTLKDIVAKVPSLNLTVHVGNDWEQDNCIATITVKDGKVEVIAPQVDKIGRLSDITVNARLMKAIGVSL